MGLFDFLIITVVGAYIVKIISRWLKTQEGVRQRQMQELEQHVQDLQKRVGVLEEIFVTEDVSLQRKLRHALQGDSLAIPMQPSAARPQEHP